MKLVNEMKRKHEYMKNITGFKVCETFSIGIENFLSETFLLKKCNFLECLHFPARGMLS